MRSQFCFDAQLVAGCKIDLIQTEIFLVKNLSEKTEIYRIFRIIFDLNLQLLK
jgi:hypothetical protein